MGFLFIIIPVVLFLIIIGGIYGHKKEQERTTALTLLAIELGWQFDAAKDSNHRTRFRQFKIFQQGHSHYAHNTLCGELTIDDQPWPIQMGDYHYKITSNSGKNRSTRTYRLSYLIIKLPFLSVPELKIRKEGLMDRVAATMGWDDIDFESAEFSKKFYVTSSNKKFAYDVIDPRMMQFLLNSEPPTIDLASGYCCLSIAKKRWEPDEFRRMLGWCKAFHDHWPTHLTDSLADIRNV